MNSTINGLTGTYLSKTDGNDISSRISSIGSRISNLENSTDKQINQQGSTNISLYTKFDDYTNTTELNTKLDLKADKKLVSDGFRELMDRTKYAIINEMTGVYNAMSGAIGGVYTKLNDYTNTTDLNTKLDLKTDKESLKFIANAIISPEVGSFFERNSTETLPVHLQQVGYTQKIFNPKKLNGFLIASTRSGQSEPGIYRFNNADTTLPSYVLPKPVVELVTGNINGTDGNFTGNVLANSVQINNNNNSVGSLCIGNTCLDEEDLKTMKSITNISFFDCSVPSGILSNPQSWTNIELFTFRGGGDDVTLKVYDLNKNLLSITNAEWTPNVTTASIKSTTDKNLKPIISFVDIVSDGGDVRLVANFKKSNTQENDTKTKHKYLCTVYSNRFSMFYSIDKNQFKIVNRFGDISFGRDAKDLATYESNGVYKIDVYNDVIDGTNARDILFDASTGKFIGNTGNIKFSITTDKIRINSGNGENYTKRWFMTRLIQ